MTNKMEFNDIENTLHNSKRYEEEKNKENTHQEIQVKMWQPSLYPSLSQVGPLRPTNTASIAKVR